MAKGFAYLVVVMDWASRKVLSWRLSNTMSTDACTDALEEAIACYGKPEIFNTDQGSQFTSEAFTGTLKANGIQISMDGKGRWMDNVFIERLWRSVKYEHIDGIVQPTHLLRRYFGWTPRNLLEPQRVLPTVSKFRQPPENAANVYPVSVCHRLHILPGTDGFHYLLSHHWQSTSAVFATICFPFAFHGLI
jgi:putative transposase